MDKSAGQPICTAAGCPQGEAQGCASCKAGPRTALARAANPEGDSRRLAPKAIFGDFLSLEKVTRTAGRKKINAVNH